jgi:hypothetical protein
MRSERGRSRGEEGAKFKLASPNLPSVVGQFKPVPLQGCKRRWMKRFPVKRRGGGGEKGEERERGCCGLLSGLVT